MINLELSSTSGSEDEDEDEVSFPEERFHSSSDEELEEDRNVSQGIPPTEYHTNTCTTLSSGSDEDDEDCPSSEEEQSRSSATDRIAKGIPPAELPTTMTWNGFRFTAKVRDCDKKNRGNFASCIHNERTSIHCCHSSCPLSSRRLEGTLSLLHLSVE